MEIRTALDMDGVYGAGFRVNEPFIIISGRTTDEFAATVQQTGGRIAIYLRTKGNYGDGQLGGEHKAALINALGIVKFYEDDELQARIIQERCPDCKVYNVQNGEFQEEW